MAKQLPHTLLLRHALFCSLFFTQILAKSTTYNVVDFGADPTGLKDSTLAFLGAWSNACGSWRPARIQVPPGQFLLGTATRFGGPCNSKVISISMGGATLVGPSDYRAIGEALHWLTFDQVSGVRIHGGVLDARGGSLWACKSSGQPCPIGAITLGITNSNNVVVTGLSSINSQLFHMIISGCNNVKVHGVKIMAPGNSPNTDGIHVQFSSDVTILNPRIRTGDDCVSVGPGTKNLWVEDIACGPGHGISIGSLGWGMNEDGVTNVTVRTATFSKTMNGFRIKSWGRPSNGFVNDVHFEHAFMSDVQNPIVIDQHYCPYYSGCPQMASGIRISDISYKDIHGTSATQVAVKFDCSLKHPCRRLRLEDVNLTYKNQVPQASCRNAGGTAFGTVQPESCF
ncbi:polygalacturonase-like [Arachis stenosperma]|uniref:polygalacturonase-like n=1 Tax=Arachis stenosperma TaxID=217475 RepID=UPI0025AC1B03|nr:polygalacturonase-like [Arachis stenosperma]